MKWYKKYFSIKHYIAVLRRQPKHMQHVYAVVFAGGITALLGAIILYHDYGFWRDTYNRNEVVVEKGEVKNEEVPSPTKMLDGFFKEVSVKLKDIKTETEQADFFEGKEVYTKEEKASTSPVEKNPSATASPSESKKETP